MNRKDFLKIAAGGTFLSVGLQGFPKMINAATTASEGKKSGRELKADLVIAGGGLGGCAAALAALRNGMKVIMTEETDWIGGQLTQQGVPPDEHQWIENHGCTKLYRDFRKSIRDYYRKNYPLTESARANMLLNPGNGSVSKLCHEPRAALAVLNEFLFPYVDSGQLILLTNHRITGAETAHDKVKALKVLNEPEDRSVILLALWFIDATETGELLPLTGTEFITGTESRNETNELHAPDKADPENNQAFTVCFAADYLPGENHVIEKPRDYDFWKNFVPDITPPWPGKLLQLSYSQPSTLKPKELGFNPDGSSEASKLNLWNYRRMIDKSNFSPGTFQSDITLVNWPQNDYVKGNLIGVSRQEFRKQVENAKQLSLSLLYWLQTEAPLPGKGYGWSGLRLRKDIMGTEDGMAKYPYIRESRRIKAVFTILEEHVGRENRALVTGKANTAADFSDSIGIGYYHIDLHPTCKGNNYIDFPSLPFQIPLGSLLPVRIENLIPACKNTGTTHITNGCYRLHPVEWNIGESAGLLVAFSNKKNLPLKSIREKTEIMADFQNFIRSQGVETHWPQ